MTDHRRRGVPGRTWLPTAFLVVTLALVCWIGYQAIDAGTSHRRTAEAVLRDYAGISSNQFARIIRGNLDDVLDEAFDDAGRRVYRGRSVSAEVVGWELGDAMRRQGCECEGFREPALLFLRDTERAGGQLEVLPARRAAGASSGLNALLDSIAIDDTRRDFGMVFLGEDRSWVDEPSVLAWESTSDRTEDRRATYGFVVPVSAFSELIEHWYRRYPLLPQPVVGEEPNDSTLFMTVAGPTGEPVFSSPIPYPDDLGATDSLSAEFGGLVVRAAIRPDAAERLIIGGLPNSRLPLLAILILITLGVGAASVVQMRREQEFQRLREDFISGVSHELRTPLAQIRMFADLQESGKLREPEDQARAIHVVHRESRRLSHLVENILQFSTMERVNGRRVPTEPLDLADAIEDGVDAVTPLLRDRGVTLDIRAEPGLVVRANRDAITRIVVNLLDNAIKYGPSDQTIRIGVAEGDVPDDSGGVATLSVEDEGPGVPRSERDRIWKAYHRLERDVKRRRPGTGIGLSVVAELVSKLGGRVRVEDAPSGGARFVVELPRWREADESSGDRSPDEGEPHGATHDPTDAQTDAPVDASADASPTGALP